MGIPKSQLEIWSHAAPTTMARDTHESIRKALESHDWPDGIYYEVYLQGSYKNNTRIRSSRSDVDIIAQLNSSFSHNINRLSQSQQTLFHSKYTDATYGWSHFRNDVLSALINYYDTKNIIKAKKCIKLKGTSNRLPADIVVCQTYRKYGEVKPKHHSDIYHEGITFLTSDGARIINYPKQHYDNGVSKMEHTNKMYKSIVRIYKNINKKLVDDGVISSNLTTSYFIECSLYNVPNAQYDTSINISFMQTLVWLIENKDEASNFICQNGITNLFGLSSTQWNTSNFIKFISKISNLWTNW